MKYHTHADLVAAALRLIWLEPTRITDAQRQLALCAVLLLQGRGSAL